MNDNRKDNDQYFTEPDGTKNYEKLSNGEWKWGYAPDSKKFRFKKGVSGNPAGKKPKVQRTVRLLEERL